MADEEISSEQLGALKRLVPKRFDLDPDRRALVEEMAKKYQIPLSKPHGFTDAAKVAALPVAGQIIGASIGAMSGNPLLTVAGEMTGGVIGTKGNEMFGISKPDEYDYYTAAGLPPAVGGVLKIGRRLLPGGLAAEHELGAEKLRDLPKIMSGSKKAVDEAYGKITAMPLPVTHFSTAVDTLAHNEALMKKYGEQYPDLARRLAATSKRIQEVPDGIPMNEVNELLKRYRERVTSTEGKGGEKYGAYKLLRKSLFDDLDAMVEAAQGAGGSQAVLLKQARNEAKAKIAKDELSEVIAEKGIKYETHGGQTFEVINPTAVLNKLVDLDFAKSAGPEVYNQVKQMLTTLAKIKRPSEAMHTGIGSGGRVTGMVGAGMAGAVIGASMHGPMGAGVGSALGAYGAVKIHDAIASLAMSPTGRSFLVKLFKHNEGRIGERTAQVLQFAASQFQDTGEMTPKREQQAQGMLNMLERPDPDAERRLQLGIPNMLTPSLRQG